MTEPTLKPCPLCNSNFIKMGEKDPQDGREDYWIEVMCLECDTTASGHRSEIVTHWNTRPLEEKYDRAIKFIERIVKEDIGFIEATEFLIEEAELYRKDG